jgi:TRAP-type transport system periplasmic protein
MRMKQLILGLVGFALMATPALSADMELRFGHVGKPGSLFAMSAEEFARRANEKLGDKAEVKVYGSSQLGDDQELLQKLKLGQVHFSLPSSVMSSVAPEFGVFEMPYIIQNRDHIRAVSEEMLDDTFQPAAERNGFKILAFWENGFRNITNNVRPINKPKDLDGVKLRTPKGEWRVKMFKAYGANPTPMAFSDVFTALKTGVIDGQENPYAQIASAKFQEVQDYLSITGHVYTPGYILVGKNKFESLPEDVQAALQEAALETQEYVYETAARLEEELLKEIAEEVEVNEADKQAFIDASQPIYDEFAETVDGGDELVKRVMSLAPSN